MLTFFKKFFIWWNQETLGTKLQTIFYGKLVGNDSLGNKYYESKSGKRWIIYYGEIDASKIPNEWYSWIHFTKNKIENNHDLKKYDWQKPHQSNQTGTNNAYHPNKNDEQIKKNIKSGKVNFLIILIFFFTNVVTSISSLEKIEKLEGAFIEIKILDKVSSKNSLLKLKIGEEKIFKNLLIKSLKCKNSEFDDNPEITAYIQVQDLTKKDNDDVFIFNGWTFLSSPAINPFDHPVYDIWLTKCY